MRFHILVKLRVVNDVANNKIHIHGIRVQLFDSIDALIADDAEWNVAHLHLICVHIVGLAQDLLHGEVCVLAKACAMLCKPLTRHWYATVRTHP